jgi:predicted AAA+ superfamily ATPase
VGVKLKKKNPDIESRKSARKSDRRKERIVVVDDDDARFYSDDITTGKFHRTCL